MGFFDEYKDEGGNGPFLSKAERDPLIDLGAPLRVVAISFEAENTFEGKSRPRYVVTFDVEGESRLWSFGVGDVESRDRLLAAMTDYLDRDGDIDSPVVMVTKEGRSQIIVPAE